MNLEMSRGKGSWEGTLFLPVRKQDTVGGKSIMTASVS